ncbi:MAG: hypothetical protein NZ561_09235, partial [Phycisphaerae bacterium]|nr:hypothetical protein [Phycisphaerae bacterium]MDW8262842.1 hypothetical protein [Phycisphaerales bacterium]
PITMIFRCFRIAVHPSKLILAAMAMLLIYLGGTVLDKIWPGGVVPGELALYAAARETIDPARSFAQAREEARKEAVARYQRLLEEAGNRDGSFRDIRNSLRKRRDEAVKAAIERYQATARQLEEQTAEAPEDKKAEARARRDEQLREAAQQRDAQIKAAYASASQDYRRAREARGIGRFEHFIAQQVGQLNAIIATIREGRWLGRHGVIEKIVAFFTIGPVWAIRHHPVFFTVFFLMFLSIWAIFGGAISRIAAVHIARDEKISIRQALRFSTSKFLSFFSAPIIPLLIVVAVGLLVAVGGLITNIPFIGPIVVGVFFFLALIAGFVMTLVILGLVGGFNLMYPTIAVEGSDSFDAISRSFSYLYARPWRLAFYTAIAVVYGALCYTFIRYFLDLMLMLTHFFSGLLVFVRSSSGDPLWNMLWPGPVLTQRLAYTPDYFSLGLGESIGSFFLWVWVHLLATLLGGFAISFYFVAGTVIYYLMRKEVDATEYDDVSLEQGEEDFSEALPTATPQPAPAASAPAG